ncbi:HlyD family secretion protein [Krasilnikovia cinnamomea]|uniref:HlyD family secretion protein n=1 Tax=Krasilnikovia cinnamomea TaxID=349313 RepID=A0A4Q7ZEJ0_9ACTN|nr:HlyD family efflux transporter periplasmic adaptor subunit [Krasilnikovia cinnamomea]RZU48369.1 HlyD family secretion protein [Krasilnikovia cinnamomea]
MSTIISDTGLDQTPVAEDAATENAEPSETGAPPPTGPRRPRLWHALRVIRTIVVVLILLAAAGIGGTHLVRQRLADRAFVDVGTAVLNAEPIPVGSAAAGIVEHVYVQDGSAVAGGARLASLAVTTTPGSPPRIEELRAPATGLVSEINVAQGQVARGGEPVVTLYDPAAMSFVVEVPAQVLRRLRLGMTAYVDGPGLPGRITTTLDRVEPKVTAAAAPTDTAGLITVVLKPAQDDLDTVRTLVPGLRFDVVVDTTTAVGHTPAVNSA